MKKFNLLDIFIATVIIALLAAGIFVMVRSLSAKTQIVTLTFTITEDYTALPSNVKRGEDFSLNGTKIGTISAIKSASNGIKIEIELDTQITKNGVKWSMGYIKVGETFEYNTKNVKGYAQCTDILVQGGDSDEN